MDAEFYTPKQRAVAPLPLFLPAPSVPVHTSELAADAVDAPEGQRRAETIRRRLLALIASDERGKTADELEEATGIAGNTIRPRLRELHTMGLIEASDTMTRQTRAGRDARVVFPTTKGRQVAA